MKALRPTVKYSANQGFFWASYSSIFAFASVFLLSRGFSNQEIGLVVALGSAASALLQPRVGAFADSRRKCVLHKLIITVSLVMILAAGLLLSVRKNFWIIALLYGLLVAFLQLNTPLIYSLGMFFINKGVHVNFGIARGIGSLVYAIASTILGRLVENYSTDMVMYSVIIEYILLAISILFMHFKGVDEYNPVAQASLSMSEASDSDPAHAAHADSGPTLTDLTGSAPAFTDHVGSGSTHTGLTGSIPVSAAHADSGSAHTGLTGSTPVSVAHADSGPTRAGRERGFLLSHKRFAVILLGSVCLFVSHNIISNYIFQIVSWHGFTSKEMGTTISIAAVLEIPILFAFTSINRRISSGILFKISGVFFTLRILTLLLANGLTMIYLAQLAQPFGYGLYVGASVYYVNHTIEPEHRVRGQAYMTFTCSVGAVIGSLVGGWLLDITSVPVMLGFGASVAAIGALIIIIVGEKGSRI